MHLRRNSRAFTLIELLVVIVILGILMAVALPTYLRQQSKAKDSNAKQQLTYAYHAIRAALPEFNNTYPSVASVVSTIQQSEPELTVASGGCNSAVTDKQVAVDPILTSGSKLALYTKSSSGNWFRLSSSTGGAQTFTQLGTCVGALSSGSLTVSGNEITDVTRSAAVQGDGASPNSSYGFWDAATNLLTNGGFELSPVTLWGGYASNQVTPYPAITRDTAHVKFGSYALKVNTFGSGPSEGVVTSPISISTSMIYTTSVWVYVTSSQQFDFGFDWKSGTTFVSSSHYLITASPGWTRLVATATSPASGIDGTTIAVYAHNTVATPTVFWMDGAQLETGSVATPYIDTNGSTATRPAARAQAPATLLNSTQGWVALRVRMGYSSSATPGTYSGLFAWGDGLTGSNSVMFHRTGNQWRMERSGGGTSSAYSTGLSWKAGDYFTVIGAWTATQVKVSVNGGAFISASNTYIPTIAATTFDIGSAQYENNALKWADSDILWFAAGKGTLTDADAQTIAGFGDNDPTTQDFPAAAQASIAWAADSPTYVTGN